MLSLWELRQECSTFYIADSVRDDLSDLLYGMNFIEGFNGDSDVMTINLSRITIL